MMHIFRQLSLAAALAVLAAGASIAQDGTAAGTAAAAGADTTATQLPPAAGELDLGQDATAVSGDPETGQTYVKETHGDWELRCVKTEDGNDPCQMYQLLADQDGNSVAEISIYPLPAGQRAAAGATIATPLETLLTEDLRLSVDGGQDKVYRYSFCSAFGCFSRVGFTAGEVAAFKRGAKGTLTIVPAAAPDQKVVLTVSLSGFTAAYDAAAAASDK